MRLPGFRWAGPMPIMGSAPVGEISQRCAGCGGRFVSGEPAMARMVGPVHMGSFVHPGCVDVAEARIGA